MREPELRHLWQSLQIGKLFPYGTDLRELAQTIHATHGLFPIRFKLGA